MRKALDFNELLNCYYIVVEPIESTIKSFILRTPARLIIESVIISNATWTAERNE